MQLERLPTIHVLTYPKLYPKLLKTQLQKNINGVISHAIQCKKEIDVEKPRPDSSITFQQSFIKPALSK